MRGGAREASPAPGTHRGCPVTATMSGGVVLPRVLEVAAIGRRLAIVTASAVVICADCHGGANQSHGSYGRHSLILLHNHRLAVERTDAAVAKLDDDLLLEYRIRASMYVRQRAALLTPFGFF